MTRKHARPPKRRPTGLLGGLALLVLITAALGGVALWQGDPDTPGAVPVASAGPDATLATQPDAAPTGTSTPPAASLDAALAAALPDPTGHLSVAVLDTATGRTATANAQQTYVSASIAKVDILAALLLQAQDENRTLTTTERANATVMIGQSDNDAADTLWQQIGGAPALRAANARLGLVATEPAAASWGLTTTTATDQLRLLQAVTTDASVLNAQSRAYLLDLMGSIATDQDWGVSAAADTDGTDPDHTVLKNGWLPRDATGLWVINSIGRITHDGRELLIAVLSDDQPSKETGITQAETAARAAATATVETVTTETG